MRRIVRVSERRLNQTLNAVMRLHSWDGRCTTYEEIAAEMGLSIATVRHYVLGLVELGMVSRQASGNKVLVVPTFRPWPVSR